MDKITIVLADDHAFLMREGTRCILNAYTEFKVVGEAEDGQKVLELIEQLKPDVAILDIRMPILNGIEVVRHIKEHCASTKALILTAYDDDDYILALMEAGALGYQMKTVSAQELANAVLAVYAGKPALHPLIAMKIASLWKQRTTAAKKGTGEPLTARETQVLELEAEGFSKKTIANKLGIRSCTVEEYTKNIFVKLGVSSHTEAVIIGLSHHLIARNEGKV